MSKTVHAYDSTGQPITIKVKSHKFRNFIVLPALFLVVLIVIIVLATSGGGGNGVTNTGGSSSSQLSQAKTAAQNYLSDGPGFSRSGLIQQLDSKAGSGFPESIATKAVDSLHVNWDQQAVEAARNYEQSGEGFSRSGLYQQLTSQAGDGFTPAQANYAISHTMKG